MISPQIRTAHSLPHPALRSMRSMAAIASRGRYVERAVRPSAQSACPADGRQLRHPLRPVVRGLPVAQHEAVVEVVERRAIVGRELVSPGRYGAEDRIGLGPAAQVAERAAGPEPRLHIGRVELRRAAESRQRRVVGPAERAHAEQELLVRLPGGRTARHRLVVAELGVHLDRERAGHPLLQQPERRGRLRCG